MDAGNVLQAFLAPVRALGHWAAPHWRRLRSQPDITLTMGEVKWGGHHPYPNDGDVTEIVIWIGFNNSGSNQGGVSGIWIEAAAMTPLYPEDQLTDAEYEAIQRSVNPALRPRTGTWLRLPLTIPSWDSRAGWMEFRVSTRGREIKFKTAREFDGFLCAQVTGKGTLRNRIPPCPYPVPQPQEGS